MVEFYKGFSTRGWAGCLANFSSEDKPIRKETKK